jgi:3-hydroxyisobutyrate dehydrogenase-like beta-hydroxyacid dehydrogenase
MAESPAARDRCSSGGPHDVGERRAVSTGTRRAASDASAIREWQGGSVDDNSIAFAGLGSMGAGMAHRLLDAGFTLTVYNRTEAKTVPLVQAGARRAGSAAALAGHRTVMLSLSDEKAVESVLFGGLAARLAPGTLVIDTSTVSPAYSRAAGERLSAHGVRRVEACVVGNPQMARAGKLRVLTAGDRQDVEAAQGTLAALGQDVRYTGPPGMASTLKLAFNMMLGAQIASLAEAVSYAERAGLPRGFVIDILANSGFCSPVLQFRAQIMRTGRYQPASFRAELMEKDLRLAADGASELGLALPVTACAAGRFAETVSAAGPQSDAAALLEIQGQR